MKTKHPDNSRDILFVVVDVVERSVTTFFWSCFCFSNFRYSVEYVTSNKSASEKDKLTTDSLLRRRILKSMSFFVKATTAGKPKSRLTFMVTQTAAAMVTVVVVAQLLTFEDFPGVLAGYQLPGGYSTGSLLAALLVTLEVFTVPYLLMMRLSPLMRLLSLACGVVSGLIWLVLGLRLLFLADTAMSNGLLGATLAVTGGWYPILFAVVLIVGLVASPKPTLLLRGNK